MDVSNDPESGRNLAAILDPKTASLCQDGSFFRIIFLHIAINKFYEFAAQ